MVKKQTQTANAERTKTTMKTTMKTTTENPFAVLLRQYEQQTDRKDEAAYTKALTDLAAAVAYSVLKKCIAVSQNKTLVQMRQSIARDLHDLDRIAYANEHAYTTMYNTDGDREQKIADKDLQNALSKLTSQCFGDGVDLVNDAVCAILSETQKARARNAGTLAECWIEKPYQVRRLNRKVWIKMKDTMNGWETANTTPIQEIYKAVRRAIDSSRAVQTDPRNGYTYLDDLATDPDSDTTAAIYRRLPKYADLGGYATDFNGAYTTYSADPETVIDCDSIIERLNLTAKQAKVLALRQSGYGYKAIATYLAIRPDSVRDCIKAIQAKAVAIGLTPTTPTK